MAAAIDWLEEQGVGAEAINYRLRDWLISRQRYWGAPIPVVHRSDESIELVADEDLPVILPEDVEFEGRSPLASTPAFYQTTDSEGQPARRETDTMDTFMCSSWYWFRYLSPQYSAAPFDPEEAAYWLPVDVYTGGAEHAVMHLLYARFFVKTMRDMGVFDDTQAIMEKRGRESAGLFDEPFLLLRNQGQILGEERAGDRLVIDGRQDGSRIMASSVRVDETADVNAGTLVGELKRRTENILQIQTDAGVVTVEVPEGATVETPRVAGVNDVSQLRHHLDVERMSKSKGNTVNPDELVARYRRGYGPHLFDVCVRLGKGRSLGQSRNSRIVSLHSGCLEAGHSPLRGGTRSSLRKLPPAPRRRCGEPSIRRSAKLITTWSLSNGTRPSRPS